MMIFNINKTQFNNISKKVKFSSEQSQKNTKSSTNYTYLGIGIASPFVSPFICKPLFKLIKSDEAMNIAKEDVTKTIDYMDKKYNLTKKGLKCFYHDKNSLKGIMLQKNYGGAGFSFSSKKNIYRIDAVKEKSNLATHEAGHAINYLCTKLGKNFGKFQENLKGIPFIAVAALFSYLVFGVGAVGTKIQNHSKKNSPQVKSQNNKKNNNFFKFLYKNAGIISTLLFLPMLIDEASASIRAVHAAKKAAPKIFKPLCKNLSVAFSTYLISTGSVIGSIIAIQKATDNKK